MADVDDPCWLPREGFEERVRLDPTPCALWLYLNLFENRSSSGSGLGAGLQGAMRPTGCFRAVSLLRSDVRPKCPHPHDSSQVANS